MTNCSIKSRPNTALGVATSFVQRLFGHQVCRPDNPQPEHRHHPVRPSAAAGADGVRTVMFTSDIFNKYPEAEELLHAMIDERLGLEFFVRRPSYSRERLSELLF